MKSSLYSSYGVINVKMYEDQKEVRLKVTDYKVKVKSILK